MNEEGEEKMVLTHAPVPGYKKVFTIVLTIAAIYLALILLNTF